MTTRLQKILRESIIERDGGVCFCGKQATQLHHITYKSHSGNNTAYNLICVCNHHHFIIHSNGKHWFKVLFKMQQKKYENLTKEMMKK